MEGFSSTERSEARSGEHVWRDSHDAGEGVEGDENLEQEKMAAKQRMESDIARLWESIEVSRVEQESFIAQVDDLEAKISMDEGMDPRATASRIGALKDFKHLRNEVAIRLERDHRTLKELEAQYQTVFGAPFVQ